MTTIFGFLDEKCIRMDICSITSWLHPIIMSLELSQLYRDLYGKMAFWPQWRHQLGAANLWQATVAEEKQLLSCVFFVRLDFSDTFFHFDTENDDSSPLRFINPKYAVDDKVQITVKKKLKKVLAINWTDKIYTISQAFATNLQD